MLILYNTFNYFFNVKIFIFFHNVEFPGLENLFVLVWIYYPSLGHFGLIQKYSLRLNLEKNGVVFYSYIEFFKVSQLWLEDRKSTLYLADWCRSLSENTISSISVSQYFSNIRINCSPSGFYFIYLELKISP